MNEKITAALKNIFIQFSTFRLSICSHFQETQTALARKTKAHTNATKRDVSSKAEREREGERHFDGEREMAIDNTHTHTRV